MMLKVSFQATSKGLKWFPGVLLSLGVGICHSYESYDPLSALFKKPEVQAESCSVPTEKSKEDTWSVLEPKGETQQVAIDTTTTTWSNLDVHPQGEHLIFDALGDIYRVSLVGGKAEPILQDFAWSMQPVYSPDGKKIAFVSDRSGALNLWTMNADGSDLKQISEEKTSLIHTPAWSPDGQYIAVSKGTMSSRSLPAGAIWMYHQSGGAGVEIKAREFKEHTQKNITEPRFSPDGRYVYYSKDVRPGLVWKYNGNATQEIFNIIRHDLQTGEEKRFIGGSGGAILPTPSPDGSKMAYIKRENDRSVLYVKDLQSGIDHRLYTGMERDNQEIFTTEGTYPRMDWTPDGESIVFWAAGRFHKVAINSKKIDTLAVQVKAEKIIQKVPSVKVAVDKEEFPARVTRWASYSPQGDKVIYQALGKLYVKSVQSGKVQRLTEQNNYDEFYPRFSPDGKHVVYTTWNDKSLGSVRVLSLDNGNSRVVSAEPGHYIEPSFSPDAKKVVFRRFGGGYLLSPEWTMNPGIYVADSGIRNKNISEFAPIMEKILDAGSQPHFSANGERIVYTDSVKGSHGTQRKLMSVSLQGKDERELLKGKTVTEFKLSPDGRWIAFTHQFNAYIAPFVATGKSRDIAHDSTWVPVRQVSKRAGEFLHWSADSKTLHWSHASTLYSRQLEDAFAFLSGISEGNLPEPVSEGLGLSVPLKREAPQGVIALTGGRIVTMRAADHQQDIIEKGTLLIKDNRIVAVGTEQEITIPQEAKILDVSGKTLVPGLIDAHAHGAQASHEIIPQQNWKNFSSLSFGVTTIHDPSNDSSEIFAASELQKAGLIKGPRIFSTGKILYGAKLPGYTALVDSYDDAHFHLQRLKEMGATSVKSYNQPRRDQRQQILKAGKDLGLLVVPEGGGVLYRNITMIFDGHHTLEHALNIPRGYDDLTQLWKSSTMAYNPTLVVAYGGLGGERYWYDRTNVWENKRLMRYVPRYIVEPLSIRREKAPDSHYNHIEVAKYAKTLRDEGVRVLIGGHGQREGLAAHWEMWMLAQGGFTPWEALRAATFDGAHALGMADELGSLEAGKLADILVIEGDVLSDIHQSQSLSYTILNGRVYNANTLEETLTGNFKPQPFFFDRLEINALPADAAKALEEKAERYHWVH